MHLDSPSRRKRGWLLTFLVIGGLLCGLIAGYYLLSPRTRQSPGPGLQPEDKPLPRMANLPPKSETRPPLPEPDYPPTAPVLEQARRALAGGIAPADAVALADALPDAPERADAAFLLLEYAAENGHADAAFNVARYYDPDDDLPSGTIRKDEASAYDWYRTSLENGRTEAAGGMEKIRARIQSRADDGDWQAEQLLKSWDASSSGGAR